MFYTFYSWWWTLDRLTFYGKALPKVSTLFQVLYNDYKQFLKEKENEASNPGKIEQKTLEA